MRFIIYSPKDNLAARKIVMAMSGAINIVQTQGIDLFFYQGKTGELTGEIVRDARIEIIPGV